MSTHNSRQLLDSKHNCFQSDVLNTLELFVSVACLVKTDYKVFMVRDLSHQHAIRL